jgi:hypothetical protein
MSDTQPPLTRWHQLIFTKDGDLDFGWVILIFCCLAGMGVFVGIAMKKLVEPSIAAWSWFGSFTTLCFIAGTAISRARLIASSGTMGEVSKGIASSAPSASYPSLPSHKDDERKDS